MTWIKPSPEEQEAVSIRKRVIQILAVLVLLRITYMLTVFLLAQIAAH